jgi:hypothetical protein
MIKCPHCGSTAQVKSNGNPHINTNTKFLVEGFYCGCGCEWEVEYERNENGYWEVYAEFTTREPIDKPKGHIHCPANGYDCPYWKDGICSLYSEEENWADPWEECSDFGMFWDEGDDYIDYD